MSEETQQPEPITKADLHRMESTLGELTAELRRTRTAELSTERQKLQEQIDELKTYIKEQREQLTKVEPPAPPPTPVIPPAPAVDGGDPSVPPTPLAPPRKRNLFRA